MAWYDDRSRTRFVGTYANEKQFQWDVEAAKKRGWTVQEPAAGEEPADEGPVIGGEHAPGGVAAPARGGKITVTFIRDQDWLETRKQEIANAIVGTATRAADAKEAKLVKAQADLEQAERRFEMATQAVASAADQGREPAEREMLNSLKDLIGKRRVVLKALEEAIKETNAAVVVGASEFARSVASHMKAEVMAAAKLESELLLLHDQEQVARTAKEWRDAMERRRAAEEELRKRTGEFEAKDATLKARMESRDASLDVLRRLAR